MKRILFVCHGNICRSPMAEAVFSHMAEEMGVGERFSIGSAAVSAEEIGEGVYPKANAELVRRGLPKSRHIAWQLKSADYGRYDLFLCMDHSNLRRLKSLFGGDGQGKVHLLLEYTAHPGEIEDPWYTGRFSRVYDMIEEGCRGLMAQLLRGG